MIPRLGLLLFALVWPAVALATVDVSLDVVPTDPAAPGAGGVWTLVAKTDAAPGLAALRVILVGVDDGAVADGAPSDEISVASGLGAIDPVQTLSGPRPPYLAVNALLTEVLYAQDVSDALLVVTGVGTPATGAGPDPFGDPAWDDATPLASGTYPAGVPAFATLAANELGGASPPFVANEAPVSGTVRVLPEPGALLSFVSGGLALACARRRRDRR